MFDKKTGGSRGFGFVLFDKNKSVEKVLRDKHSHSIRGKWIDCKPSYNKDDENESFSDDEVENEGNQIKIYFF